MTDRELMQQALTALERGETKLRYEAITTLRAAIEQAQPEQEPRQWQGLTGQEIKDCEKQAMVNGSLPFEQRFFFARVIEAKLKEKNT